MADLRTNLGDFFSNPGQAGAVLGQMGAAVMGPDQTSWQAQLGKIGSAFGQSRIAAEAAQARQQLLRQLVAGLGGVAQPAQPAMTPVGAPGPSSQTVTMKKNADGTYKKTTVEDGDLNQNGIPDSQERTAPAPQSGVPNLPTGEAFNLLPFFLPVR